jgi:hypothetical protein
MERSARLCSLNQAPSGFRTVGRRDVGKTLVRSHESRVQKRRRRDRWDLVLSSKAGIPGLSLTVLLAFAVFQSWLCRSMDFIRS